MIQPPYSAEERRKLEKIYIDMYEGDGKENPPIVTRLDRVERATLAINRLSWLCAAAILTAVGDIIVTHFK